MGLISGERKRWGTLTKSAPSEVTTGAQPGALWRPWAPQLEPYEAPDPPLRTLHIWQRLLTLVPPPLIKPIQGLVFKAKGQMYVSFRAKIWSNLSLGAVVGPFKGI